MKITTFILIIFLIAYNATAQRNVDLVIADATWHYMFHCYISLHEDEGMMGQFVVKNTATPISTAISNKKDFLIYHNLANNKIFIKFLYPPLQVNDVSVIDAVGKTVYVLPSLQLQNGIDVKNFANEIIYLQLTNQAKNKCT